MEHDLGGGHHMEPPVAIQLGKAPKGLHHGLIEGFGVEGTVKDDITVV